MMSTVIGGAMLPHAPQFFTMPETEDKKNVEHVREVAADVGKKLRALEPDLWIIFSNDHAEQFFHATAPPFTVHVGGEASGDFAGRKFHWKIPSEIGFEIVRQLYRQNFDPAFTSTAKIDYAIGIPLTHLGHTDPVLPIYVNAYLPPQPTMERCYAFGQAVARTVTALGLKTVVLASGGMSHFPGTDRYSNPELDWDTRATRPSSTTPAISSCAAGPARPARWASASPISCPWIRAGITTTPRWPGPADTTRHIAPRIIPRSSPSSSSSRRRSTVWPTTPSCARNTWPTRRPSRINSSFPPISARR